MRPNVRNKLWKEIGLASCWSSMLLMSQSANALGPYELNVDGFLRQHMSWNLHDQYVASGEKLNSGGKMSMNRTTLQLEASLNLPYDAALIAIGRVNWEQRLDYLRDLEERGAYGDETIGGYYDDEQLRELYLDIPLGERTVLKLGKQQVVWGGTDFFQAMDVVHGFDYRWRNFLEPANEDVRKPLIMANAIIDFPEVDGSLQLLFRPGWDDKESIGNSFDLEGGRWATNPNLTTYFPAATPYNYEHPDGDYDDPTYGIRWNGLYGGVGYSLAYQKTFFPNPVMNANPAFGGTPFNGVYNSDLATTIGEIIYPKVDMLGLNLNGYAGWGDFVWSAEVAYFLDAPFNIGGLGEGPELCNNALPNSFCGIEEKDIVRSMVRVDKNINFLGEILMAEKPAFFSVQLFDTWIRDFQRDDLLKLTVGQPQLVKEHSSLLTTIVGLSYKNATVIPELVAGFDLTYGGGFAVPSLTYVIGDHWRIKGELDLFWSSDSRTSAAPVDNTVDTNQFGFFKDRDQFALTATYQF